MSTLIWSKEHPTCDGYWWYRHAAGTEICRYRFDDDGAYVEVDSEWVQIDTWLPIADFAGPIPEPEEPR